MVKVVVVVVVSGGDDGRRGDGEVVDGVTCGCDGSTGEVI